MFTSVKQKRVLIVWVASLAIHILILFLLHEKPQPSKSQPTKIVKILQSVKPTSRTTPTIKSSNRKPISHSESVANRKPLPKLSYQDLLPGALTAENRDEIEDSNRPALAPHPLGKFEKPILVTKEQTPLLQLAREFSDYFQIPFNLTEVERNGSATVNWVRENHQWKIAHVDGIPYFRAYLYEEIKKLTPSMRIAELMDKLERNSLELTFTFRTVSHSDLTFKELTYFADAGSITIQRMRQWDDMKWSLVAPSSATTIGINFLGAGLMAYQALKNDCLECSDLDLKRLRNSPAFSKPFKK